MRTTLAEKLLKSLFGGRFQPFMPQSIRRMATFILGAYAAICSQPRCAAPIKPIFACLTTCRWMLSNIGTFVLAALLLLLTMLPGMVSAAPGWNTATNLNVARGAHTATLLPDGKILITGGSTAYSVTGGTATASAELFNPSNNTRVAANSMTVARFGHSVAMLTTGKVLLAGGNNASGTTATAELYDAVSGTWSATGAMNIARYGHTSVVLPNGSVLVMGGFSTVSNAALNSSELYNPTTASWTLTSGAMSQARYFHSSTLLPGAAGQVLVVGGTDGAGVFSSAEIFTPATGNWAPIASMISARQSHTATLLPNGKVLIAAGLNATGTVAQAELYDPTSATWSATGNALTTARYGHSASLLPNGTVLVAAGLVAGGTFSLVSPTAESYNPTTNQWTSITNLATARYAHSATMMANGQLLIVGGANSTSATQLPISSIEIYDPAVDSISYVASRTIPRAGASSTLLPNGKVLLVGGGESSAELYDPDLDTWTATGAMTEIRQRHAAVLLLNGNVLVVGGSNGINGNTYPDRAEIYNPALGTWSSAGNLLNPTPPNDPSFGVLAGGRIQHTLTLLADGRVLLVGGSNGGPFTLGNAQIYDPATNQWSLAANLGRPRAGHTATLLPNGKVLIAGGYFLNNQPQPQIAQLYDPALNTWADAGLMTSLRVEATATLLGNGKVLVAGGRTQAGAANTAPPTAELYDSATNTWTATPNMTVGHSQHAAALLPNGKVIVHGGYADSVSIFSRTIELYDPAANSWSSRGAPVNSTQVRLQSATLMLNGKVLITGGSEYFSVATVEAFVYDPGTPSISSLQPTLTSVNNASLSGATTLTGSGFRPAIDTASGNTQAASTNYPLVQVTRLDSGLTKYLPIDANTSFTNTSFTSTLSGLNDFQPGHAFFRVIVNGVSSKPILRAVSQSTVADAPVIGTASTSASATAVITFTASTNNGGATITSYTATSAPGNITGTCNTPCSTITVSGLINGQTYTFTVAANNLNGASAPSQPSNSVLPIGPQAIVFGPLANVVFGSSVTASAVGGLSGNPVIFSSLTSTICTVSGTNNSIVSTIAGGLCIIAANQAAGNGLGVAPQVTQSFTVTQASQTITFGAQSAQTFAPSATFALNPAASASSGLNITYSATTASVCTVSGTTVSILSGGTCTIAADQAGNSNFSPAVRATQDITINRAAQTITFAAQTSPLTFTANASYVNLNLQFPQAGNIDPANIYPITPLATASSGLTPIYLRDFADEVCFVQTSPTPRILVIRAGVCNIFAAQLGDTNYAPATQVVQSVLINKGDQIITFGAQARQNFAANATYQLNPEATLSSGLAPTYTSLTSTICDIQGSVVTMLNPGTCTIAANQTGDANVNAAPQVTQNIILGRATQAALSIGSSGSSTPVGATLSLSSLGGSGTGAVTFASNTANCSIIGAILTGVSVGSCTITATKAGDVDFEPASSLGITVTVVMATQAMLTVSSTPSSLPFGATATLNSMGGSGTGGTTFASDNANCSISGATLTAAGVGSCSVTATKAADSNYFAATSAAITVTITRAAQTIMGFVPASPVVFGATPATLSATGGASGNLVTFSTSSAASTCIVSGNQVTFVGVGTCIVTANQLGSTNYTAAAPVNVSIVINQAPQATLTASSAASSLVFGATTSLSSLGGSSTGAVSFASSNANCTIAGNVLTAAGVGTCNVTATKAGDTNYLAITSAAIAITITQAPQTITGFAPTSPVVFGAAPATLLAIGGASGVNLTFSTSSAASICVVSGNQVTFVGAGTCNLTANQAGNTNYAAATAVNASIVINQAPQVTLTASSTASSLVFGSTTTLNTVGGLGSGAVSFAANNANCTIAGSVLTAAGVGTCDVTATKASDTNYLAVTSAAITITITQAPQATLTASAISTTLTFGTTTSLGSAGGLGAGAVSFASNNANCTIVGSVLTAAGVGSCSITATKAADTNYLAATSAAITITIIQAPQTINFTAPSSIPNNSSPFIASANATSGLTVLFTTTTPAICTSSGATGATITLTGALGTCTVRAVQAGNVNYIAAANMDRNISVTNQPLPPLATSSASLTVNVASSVSYGTPFTLNAQINGNNPSGVVTFSVSTGAGNSLVCSNVSMNGGAAACVVPRSLRPVGNNTYTVTFDGDSRNSGSAASLTLQIGQATPILTLAASPVKPVAGQNVILTALLAADDPVGAVTFSIGATPIAGCSLIAAAVLPGQNADPDAAVASCVMPNITAGTTEVTASYAGSVNNRQTQTKLTLNVSTDGPVIDYSDMWWAGIAENGWGLSIAQKGKVQFNAFYIYEANGKPVWTVMPGGQWNSNFTVYTGLLYQPTSAPFSNYDVNQFKPGVSVGSATLTFTDANNAVFSYTINGASGTKLISRQPFGTTDNQPRIIINDLWWADIKENGWGINIAQQARTLFMVWYTYGADGNTIWFTVPGGTWNGTIFTGDIYATTSSPWLGVNYDAAKLKVTKVGTMVIDFEDANKALMTYSVNGITQTKVVTRQPF
jgi:N-acetylneuraminic acid mutarotase